MRVGLAALGLLCALATTPAHASAFDGEEAVVASTGGVVERKDDCLIVHLTSGTSRTHGCDPKSDLLGHLKGYDRARGLLVLHYTDGDIDDYSVIDLRTGDETFFEAEPEFSPDGDVALEIVAGEFVESFNKRPAINVWRRHGGKFEREWSMPIPAEGQYAVLGWASNERIDVEWTASDIGLEDTEGKALFSLIQESGRWRRVDRPAWLRK